MRVTKSFFAVLFVVLLVLACGLNPTRAQEATGSTYKAESTLVIVDAIVTDRKGKIVPGLRASDFKLYEDGVEQKIVNFAAPTSTEDAAPMAAPTQRPDIAQRENITLARSITVVLDVADSRPLNIKRSCDTVLAYLRKVGNDQTQVAIYYVDYGLHLALPFTTDRAEAQKALEELQQRGSRGRVTGTERRAVQQQIDDLFARAHPEAMRGAVPGGTDVTPGARSAPGEPFARAYMREIDTLRTYLAIQNTYSARDTLTALRSIALSYRDLPGRKNVVLFSEGFPYAAGARQAMDNVIAAADLANVSFYVIDPSGLETGAGIEGMSGNTLNSQMNEVAMEGIGAQGGQTKFDRMRALGDRSNTEQLEQLASSTGGFLVKNTNDLTPAFSRILADTRSFYVMAYRPSNPTADGSFRSIRLQVTGEGLELRHRKGYWAIPRGRGVMMSPAGAQLLASIASGAVEASMKPPISASVMLAADGAYYLPISVAVPAALAAGKKSDKGDPLTIIAVARDASGRVLSAYEKEWRLSPEAEKQPGNITFQGQLPLADSQPARVDVLLRLPGGGYGMNTTPLAVREKTSPQLSSVVLGSEMELVECVDRSEALCIGNIRLHQPAAPRFKAESKLISIVAVSGLSVDPQTSKPHLGGVFSVKQGGTLLGSIPDKNVQAVPGPTPDSVWLVAQLPLKSLKPGSYTMEVVARDFAANSTATAVTSFQVE